MPSNAPPAIAVCRHHGGVRCVRIGDRRAGGRHSGGGADGAHRGPATGLAMTHSTLTGGHRPSRRPLALLGLAAGLIIAAGSAALLWSAKLPGRLAPSTRGRRRPRGRHLRSVQRDVPHRGRPAPFPPWRPAADDMVTDGGNRRVRGAWPFEKFCDQRRSIAVVGIALAVSLAMIVVLRRER